MPNQIFKFPGFFSREIDLTAATVTPTGIPAGVIGSAEKGPAFVPVTLGSFEDFRVRFGDINPNHVATYAVDKFLENRSALTYLRVLGAGSNETTADIDTTRTQGTVKNAGFKLNTIDNIQPGSGGMGFIVARHIVSASEAYGYPMFSNNDTYFTSGSSDEVYLVRAAIAFNDYGFGQITSVTSDGKINFVYIGGSGDPINSVFTNYVSKQVTFSLDPAADDYIANVLNTDPQRYSEEGILLYADYAVDANVATMATGSSDVLVVSGSSNTSSDSGDTALTFRNMFGRFDTRYTTPSTTFFISQPYGNTEYDLFRVESIDDGAYANNKYKISIVGLQKSSNPRYDFGTFSLIVREFNDTDVEPRVLEQFNNLTLDPNSENYIARVIGDKKAYFNFDVETEEDRRLVTTGKYPNRSKLIRVVMNPSLEDNSHSIPNSALPFGFRGNVVPKTNSLLVDATGSGDFSSLARLSVNSSSDPRLQGSIVPPVPMRFKVTRGNISTDSGQLIGAPGNNEIVDNRYCWGIKFERTDNVLNPNVTLKPNRMIESITKFFGIEKLDAVVTGSDRDTFNNNKFTLARVALGNDTLSEVTSSVANHMREACYIRNGVPDGTNYEITDGSVTRVTLATLFHKGATAAVFNRFSDYTKFSTVMAGGFDGTNILDKNAANFTDRATSSESRGLVYGNTNSSFISPGSVYNQNGTGLANNSVFSLRRAADIMTDSVASNINLLAVPGQRDSLVTEYVADRVADFGLALYTQDIPMYNADNDRIFDGETTQHVDVDNTADAFESRALDLQDSAAYFPNVVIDDQVANRRVTVPASVAALAALGFNDKVAYPWFAPAGFNRASLGFVSQTQARIKQEQRERLYSVNINPIVKYPREGYVIFAQETLKQDESALQSINVQRMLSEVKRQVIDIGNKVIWENITPALYSDLDKNITNALSVVQTRQGIDRFIVTVDETNNSAIDREKNLIKVRVLLKPTRSIEFVAIDFIITRSGVQFA